MRTRKWKKRKKTRKLSQRKLVLATTNIYRSRRQRTTIKRQNQEETKKITEKDEFEYDPMHEQNLAKKNVVVCKTTNVIHNGIAKTAKFVYIIECTYLSTLLTIPLKIICLTTAYVYSSTFSFATRENVFFIHFMYSQKYGLAAKYKRFCDICLAIPFSLYTRPVSCFF